MACGSDDERLSLAKLAEQAVRRIVDNPPARTGTPSSYWDFHDRKVGEWGVVRTLADELKRDGIRIFSEVACRPETRPPTPPDVTARNETGQLVGFEVSEILSKQALEENVLRRQELRNRLWDAATGVERHRSRESGRGIEEFVERQKFVDAQDTIGTTFFRWSAPLLVQHLHEVIATKSKKSFAEDSEPFAERHLVLCTDERMIDEPMARAAVESLPSTPHQFSGVWLILGPNHIGYHPYFRVH